jgi:hydrogenase-4 component B
MRSHPLSFASIVLILIAGDAISFLISWETMSIASYLLVNFECEREESSRAGFVMLAMSEAGTIAVAIAFLLLARTAGALAFGTLRLAETSLAPGIDGATFLLSFFGFAVKAGLVPLNSWLPLAHPVAPTNVSALLSAVIVNLGMPWTSGLFLIGVLSISALPPMNGFVSEWLTLQTILRSAILSSAPIKVIFAISGALLA